MRFDWVDGDRFWGMTWVGLVLFGFGLVLPLGCGEGEDGGEGLAPNAVENRIEGRAPGLRSARSGAIRLIGALDEAEVDSPLSGLAPVSNLSSWENGGDRNEILVESFEEPRRVARETLRWSRGLKLGNRPGSPENSRALFLGSGRLEVPIGVRPNGSYRIELEFFNVDVPTRVQLVEIDRTDRSEAGIPALGLPKDAANPGNWRWLTVHEVAPRHWRTERDWRRLKRSISVGATTNLLLLRVVQGEGGKGWVDELRVEEMELTREERLARLKAESLAEGEAPERGMVKYGRLLPIDHLPRRGSSFPEVYAGNYEYRTALFAPPPTRIRYRVDVPRDARLRFSCGLWERSFRGETATFRIVVAPERGSDREEQVLFERRLTVTGNLLDWTWDEETLDLAGFEGQRVVLTLETLAEPGTEGLALWSNPVLDVPVSSRKGGETGPTGRTEPPNILLILIDTLRADRLSCYGYSRKTSPNLDGLAAEGVLFEQAISAGNWTPTSVASLFTGLFPALHRVDKPGPRLRPGLTTLAEILRDKGWMTHGIMWKDALYDAGFEQGFDSFFAYPGSVHDRLADNNLARALDWLEDNHDRRFFLFLHFDDPHQSFNQPPPFDRLFNDLEEMRELGVYLPIHINNDVSVRTDTGGCERCIVDGRFSEKFVKLTKDLYDGEIAYVDDRIGYLLRALKDYGVYDETIIAVVSDHGEMLWDHEDWYGHEGDYFYDELIRVPMILKPSVAQGWPVGKRFRPQVRLQDLMPTLLEAVGLEPSKGLPPGQAQSFLEWCKEGEASESRVAWSELPRNGNLSFRDGRWKYMLVKQGDARGYEEHLYDLKSDPKEKENLASSLGVESFAQVLARVRLHACDYWISNRGGRYVVVLGEGELAGYEVEVPLADGTRCRAWLGLAPVEGETSRPKKFSGIGEGLVFFSQVVGLQDEGSVEVVRGPGDGVEGAASRSPVRWQEYRAGELQRLMREGRTGVFFFQKERFEFGAGGGDLEKAKRADVEESLRKLGYVR